MKTAPEGTEAFTRDCDVSLLEALWPDPPFHLAALNVPHKSFFAANGVVSAEEATARSLNVALVLLDDATARKYDVHNDPPRFYWLNLGEC